MRDKLYKFMDWRSIEGVLYADIDNPMSVLGPKNVKGGCVIQALVPDAVEAYVQYEGETTKHKMEEVEEGGYFAVLLSQKLKGVYKIIANYANGESYQYYDPYQFAPDIPLQQLKKFNAGINYEVYKYLGAHPANRDGVKGYTFAVWAPMAKRVSVVGDFDQWDGRRHIMERIEDTGVFAIFIPGVKDGDLYKYEIKKNDGMNVLKADPYGFCSQKRPDNASVVCDIEGFRWSDNQWIKKREKQIPSEMPMSIYEVHLGSWKKPVAEITEQEGEGEQVETDSKSLFYNYRELAPMLCDYVKDMGYTHIELMPVMEHPFDGSWGYQVTGYYAPTARYGTPEDFMYFVDYMHKNNIGVILDWVPAHFPKDEFGLARFDGTCLYEHLDPRQGEHPHWGTLIYNYGRPEVSNFLIANAMFWVNEYHADGIRMDAVASMLYLDYGKNAGEWVANIYGGHENLEAVEFLKHLNSQMKKRCPGALVIAEESTAWAAVTGDVEHDGLGFDFKWNMGWMNDFSSYMRCDPYFRKNNYNQLTFSMLYQYSEDYILVFSHDEVVHGKGSMIGKMPGDKESVRFANLRAAYGFMMAHPGKKLLFMGQEFGCYREWSEERELDWKSLDADKHKQLADYVKALNKLYTSNPSMYEQDDVPNGFEWMNCNNPDQSTVSFMRRGKNKDDMILVVCNFDTIQHEEFVIGVPQGKYKEILNSDDIKFGGSGFVNSRTKVTKKVKADGRPDSLTIKLAPLSVAMFKFSPVAEKETTAKKAAAPKKEAAAKKVEAPKKETTAKKAETPKKETTAKKAEAPKKEATPKKAVVEKKDAAAKKATTKKK
ncbi:MAG: 1,4-alpha-glucan branching protein GlgB [Lachnospiraceae bacterium]|nr:1,4-alpha-glucan branching protein GlgB [Lachnospiraceae bacterium]